MNDHDRIRAALAGVAAGTLAPDDNLRAHLEACTTCAAELERFRRLAAAVERLPQPELSAAALGRMKRLAIARREAVLEHRWNRLVLTGLILYGWALFAVIAPLVPVGVDWVAQRLAMPWFAVVALALGLWWSFCLVVGLALLPVLRAQSFDLEEKVL